jgi:ABC-type uncharacterized transport system ATPase subunit
MSNEKREWAVGSEQSTHDLEDVKQLADKVIVINHGIKVFDDTLQKLQLYLGEEKKELPMEEIITQIYNSPYASSLPHAE